MVNPLKNSALKTNISRIFILIASILTIGGCDPLDEDKELKAYYEKIDQCREELKKSPLIPIIGGGYLDTRYFAFNVPSVRYVDGQCGTDLFTAEFWWTGEKIVANSMEMMGINIPNPIPRNWNPIPRHWVLFHHVGVKLENMEKLKNCNDPYKSTQECQKQDINYPAMDIPQYKKITPKNYPNLEIWLTDRSYKTMSSIIFTIPSWRRPDGYPRFITCSPSGEEYDKSPLTKEDYENIDFKHHKFLCRIEFQSLPLKGGVARANTGTDALKDIVPALKALEAYLNQSIILE